MAVSDMSPTFEGDAADQQLYRADGRKEQGMCRTRSGIRYKGEEGMMNGLRLTQWVWSGSYGLDIGDLIAA